jgi:hypothetical protein
MYVQVTSEFFIVGIHFPVGICIMYAGPANKRRLFRVYIEIGLLFVGGLTITSAKVGNPGLPCLG